MIRARWVTMKLKYLGTCSVCLRPIDAGKEAQWAQGIGVRHISCGKKADEIEELKKKLFEAIIHDNVDAAKEFAHDALDIEPNEKEIFSMAQSFYDDWDFQGAITLYDKILKNNPNHTDTLMSKASALRYIERYPEAISCYNKIIKKQPKNIEALQCKAFVYTYNIRDCQKAIPIVKKILKISPSDGADCAMKFASCGEYERAIKLAMKTLDANQDQIAPRMRKLEWLISFTLEQKTEKDALVIINKYLKNEPKFFIYSLKYRFYTRAAQHGKAYVWDLSELRDSAGEMYSRMLKEEPETDVDAIIKSNILAGQSDHDATIKFCEDNMHRDNIYEHLQMTKAFAYKRQGKPVKALEIFVQMQSHNLEHGLTNTTVLREMAEICEEAGDEKNALSTYEQILHEDRDDREILVKVIHLRKKRDKADSSLSYLERLHRLYPNNNNSTMGYANALMEGKQYGKARDLYEPIAEQYHYDETNDDAKIALLKIAECTLKLGDVDTAYKIFRDLVKDDNKFKEAWAGLAKAAMELGKRDKAEKAIKKAANLEKYEFSRDVIEPERVEGMPFTPTTATKGTIERSISKGKNVVQKPTFRYNPKTKKLDKGVEKTFVSNVDSLLNSDGGVVQIGITEKKPTGLFNDLKLLPKEKRTHPEFEKKIRETLQNRLSDSNIERDIRITFPKTRSVTICEIFVPKSSIPIWVKTKNKTDEEFYVRQKDKLARLSPKEQSEYIQEHFFEFD